VHRHRSLPRGGARRRGARAVGRPQREPLVLVAPARSGAVRSGVVVVGIGAVHPRRERRLDLPRARRPHVRPRPAGRRPLVAARGSRGRGARRRRRRRGHVGQQLPLLVAALALRRRRAAHVGVGSPAGHHGGAPRRRAPGRAAPRWRPLADLRVVRRRGPRPDRRPAPVRRPVGHLRVRRARRPRGGSARHRRPPVPQRRAGPDRLGARRRRRAPVLQHLRRRWSRARAGLAVGPRDGVPVPRRSAHARERHRRWPRVGLRARCPRADGRPRRRCRPPLLADVRTGRAGHRAAFVRWLDDATILRQRRPAFRLARHRRGGRALGLRRARPGGRARASRRPGAALPLRRRLDPARRDLWSPRLVDPPRVGRRHPRLGHRRRRCRRALRPRR
jgi:hypothetical protein